MRTVHTIDENSLLVGKFNIRRKCHQCDENQSSLNILNHRETDDIVMKILKRDEKSSM